MKRLSSSLLPFGISRKSVAHILLLLCQLFWSLWHCIASITLQDGTNPIIFALYRELTASICMLSLVFIIEGPQLKHLYIDRVDIFRFMCLGFCSFVNVVFAIVALEYISATAFAVIQPIIPCIATFISVLVGLEQSSLIKTLGILIAVAGAVVIEAWNSNGKSVDDYVHYDYLKGYITVACHVTAMACLIVFQKSMVSKYPPSTVSFLYYSIGSLFTCLLCMIWPIWGSNYDRDEWVFDNTVLPWYTTTTTLTTTTSTTSSTTSTTTTTTSTTTTTTTTTSTTTTTTTTTTTITITTTTRLALLYASLIASVFTFTSVSYACRQLQPSTTTVYWTCQPIFTATLSFFILHQNIHLNELLGGILVVLGLCVTLKGRVNDYSSVAADDEPVHIVSPLLINEPLQRSLLPLNDTDDEIRLVYTLE